MAASSKPPEFLDTLFKKRKTVGLEARTSLGYTPLMCAIEAGREDNVEKLLNSGANINAKDDSANGVLHLASTLGNSSILRTLIHSAASLDINGLNGQGHSPLSLAAAKNHYTSVFILLDAGGDPDLKNENDRTLLHHVALRGSKRILTRLKSGNVSFDLEAMVDLGRTPLLCAIEKGHRLTAKHLLDEGASIHAVDMNGYGLFHAAAYHGRADIISIVSSYVEATRDLPETQENLKHVIDINAGLPLDRYTPLGLAAKRGHSMAFLALLDNQADLEKTNHDCWNALHIAAVNKKRDIVKVLFDRCEARNMKFDVNTRDKTGRTALMLLEKQGAKGVDGKYLVKKLLAQGAKRTQPMPERDEKTEEETEEKVKESEWWESCGGFCNIDGL